MEVLVERAASADREAMAALLEDCVSPRQK
jgi:hypothetical protein